MNRLRLVFLAAGLACGLFSAESVMGILSADTVINSSDSSQHQELERLPELRTTEALDSLTEFATSNSMFLAILLYTGYCDNCDALEAGLLHESAMYGKKEFIPVKIDGHAEFGKLISLQHDVEDLPAIVIASGQGNYVTHQSEFAENDVAYFIDQHVDLFLNYYDYRQKFFNGSIEVGQLPVFIEISAEMGHLLELQAAAARLDSLFRVAPDKMKHESFRKILIYLPGTSGSSIYRAYKEGKLDFLEERERNRIADNIYGDIVEEAAASSDSALVGRMIGEILRRDRRFSGTFSQKNEEYVTQVNSIWKNYHHKTGNTAAYMEIMEKEINAGRSTPFIEARELLDRSNQDGFIRLALLELKKDLEMLPSSAHYSYLSYGYLKLNNPDEAAYYYRKARETLTSHPYPQHLVRILAPYFE